MEEEALEDVTFSEAGPHSSFLFEAPILILDQDIYRHLIV
jgi:hypothetical protein